MIASMITLEAPRVIDLAPGQLAVISLNDLMMDRLLQATGGEPITMDEAVRLATAAYERLDWGTSLVDQMRLLRTALLPERSFQPSWPPSGAPHGSNFGTEPSRGYCEIAGVMPFPRPACGNVT